MAFKSVQDLDCETTTQIGGKDKKTGKSNPKSVEGYYIGFKPTTSKFGPGKIHVFQTENGNLGVWGKTDMDNKLSTVIPGHMTRVTFTGTVPSKKGNDMWKFKVEVDQDNQIEVAETEQLPTGNQEPESENYSLDSDDSDPDSEDLALDDATPQRPQAPRQPAAAPNAARQAQVQALLRGNNKKSA